MGIEVPLSADAVATWLRGRGFAADSVSIGDRTPLSGGVAAELVERVRITADGRRADVVVKRTGPAEAIALRLLRDVPRAPAIPELIDSGTDAHGPWLVMPHYPGDPLPAEAELPPLVYECLARVHAVFQQRACALPADLPRLDRRWCHDAFTGFATGSILRARSRHPHPFLDRALAALADWAEDPLTYAGIEELPATLLHGDAYGNNALVSANSAHLVDWGCARVGPAMLDVAMAAGPDSPGLSAYLRSWADFTGAPMDPWQAEFGHAWASLINNAIYLGAVFERFGIALAEQMLRSAHAAHARLAVLVRQRGK